MDPSQSWILIPIIALVIPVVAIVMGGITNVLSKYMQFKIDLAQHQQAGVNGTDKSVVAELQQLKDEMARLRDTTTQYDLSIQHTLDDVQHRLSSLESMPPASRSVAIKPEIVPQTDILINRT